MRHTPRVRWFVIAAATSTLAGCVSARPLYESRSVPYAQDAAHVYVASYPAVPWNEIADKIEPKHNLTTETARNIAAVTTQAQVSQFLSAFSAGLGIGLPTRSITSTTTTTDGREQMTTTRIHGSGTPPSSSGETAVALSDASLVPDLSKAPPSVGLDASTLLTTGTAVFQLAQILDHQIGKAFYPAGYHAHLLTFQVALQPKIRNGAYDVYVDLSFRPASWNQAVAASEGVEQEHGALPPVVVYPLVISDAMETASTARSVEIIRQAALQLSGVISQIGATGSIGGGTGQLDSVIGQARNSIVTVGRISDHAIRIRLGAQNSAESRFAMVPRTHNISLVVLTRWPLDDAGGAKRVTNLSAFAEALILPVSGGEPLPSAPARARDKLAAEVGLAVAKFGFTVVEDCSGDAKTDPLANNLDLLRAVDRQDYATIHRCLELPSPKAEDPRTDAEKRRVDGLTLGQRIRLERLLADLVQIQATSMNSKMFIPLRPREKPALPKDQRVTLSNGKQALTATIRGGIALRADQMSAELELSDSSPVIARNISVRDRGAEVTVAFPPLSELGQVNPKGATLTLFSRHDLEARQPAVSKYAIADVVPAETEDKSLALLSVGQTILVPDDAGVARLSVSVAQMQAPPPLPLRIRVAGADFREETGGPAVTADGMTVQPKSLVRLVLGNLVPQRAVTLSLVTQDPDSKKDVKVGEPLTLQVAR